MRKNGVFKCLLALVLVLTLIGTISVSALAEESTTEPTSEDVVEYEDRTPFAAAKSELADVHVWDDLANQSAPVEETVTTVDSDMVGTIVPVATLVFAGVVAGIVTVAKKNKESY